MAAGFLAVLEHGEASAVLSKHDHYYRRFVHSTTGKFTRRVLSAARSYSTATFLMGGLGISRQDDI